MAIPQAALDECQAVADELAVTSYVIYCPDCGDWAVTDDGDGGPALDCSFNAGPHGTLETDSKTPV